MEQCWDLYKCPQDLLLCLFQCDGSGYGRSGGRFGSYRLSAYSVASMSSKLTPTTPIPSVLSDDNLSREEIDAFYLFVSQLETPSTTFTSFTNSTSGTSALAFSTFVSTSQDSWIIDAGAFHYMTGMSSLFTSYHVNYGKDKVHITDGCYSSIPGHEDIPTTSIIVVIRSSCA